MKAIKTYETKQEYLNDIESLPVPSIQYVKETDESCIRKKNNINQYLTVYLDDFPEEYMQDYDIQAYCGIDPEGEAGVWKIFTYKGDTVEIDGKTFYLWESNRLYYDGEKDDTWGFLLTTTADYDELYNQSIDGYYEESGYHDYDFRIPFPAFVIITRNDKQYFVKNEGTEWDIRLAKIERETNT